MSGTTTRARLADLDVGWAYCDQSVFNPRLHALAELRSLIVKRPALATVEVMAGPVRGRRRTHVVTGYVHKPYARIYMLLVRCAGFDSALIVRGVEGGIIPSEQVRDPPHVAHVHAPGLGLEVHPGLTAGEGGALEVRLGVLGNDERQRGAHVVRARRGALR